MPNERRRIAERRSNIERRKSEGSMINALAGYDGPERRVSHRRDIFSDRRNH